MIVPLPMQCNIWQLQWNRIWYSSISIKANVLVKGRMPIILLQILIPQFQFKHKIVYGVNKHTNLLFYNVVGWPILAVLCCIINYVLVFDLVFIILLVEHNCSIIIICLSSISPKEYNTPIPVFYIDYIVGSYRPSQSFRSCSWSQSK